MASKEKKETIFITWHMVSHGVAYFKHILSAFYSENIYNPKKGTLNTPIKVEQEKMNKVFYGKKTGFEFDKVYFICTSQEAIDKISRRRFSAYKEILEYPAIKNNPELIKVWKKIFDEFSPEKGERNLEAEKKFVNVEFGKEIYQQWFSELWRTMQFYSINDQIKWLKEYSNIPEHYKKKIEIKEFKEIKNYRNIREIMEYFLPYLRKIKEKHTNSRVIINVSLSRAEIQLLWYLLSENLYLPAETYFITAYDERYTSEEREKIKGKEIYFYPIIIKQVPKNLSEFLPDSRQQPAYPVREQIKKQFDIAFKAGFSILLLGERGVGKSQLVEDFAQEISKKVIKANCASLHNSDIALSELFGYKKGAFTGATTDKNGLFKEANGNILFLDEVHHLDYITQAKLLVALQTDDKNNFSFRPLGSTEMEKVKFNIIFASNLPIKELKQKLLPDFYDRIAQSIIEIPPIRTDKKNIEKYFQQTWLLLKFNKHENLKSIEYEEIKKRPDFGDLIKWIKTLPLTGNFRDLQKIALYYFQFINFDKELKKHFEKSIKIKNAYEYAKHMFENFHLNVAEKNTITITLPQLSLKEAEKEFKRQYIKWFINKYKNKREVAKKLNVAPSTLYRNM